jgi:molybdate transport system ATP-binding protein
MLEVKIIKHMPGFNLTADFCCSRGNLVGLTGPSGAGKTTLIRIIAGLATADEGYIRFQGTTWFDSRLKLNLRPQARNIGYVFQEHTLFPHLTVRGNIAFTLKDQHRVDQLLALFKISHIAEHKPHQISGGERQRTAFAQALARAPKVLLLDEPFSALDSACRNRLQHELKKLKTALDLPIIHVTHDLAEAEYLADCLVNIDRKFPPCHCLPDESRKRSVGLPLTVNVPGTFL